MQLDAMSASTLFIDINAYFLIFRANPFDVVLICFDSYSEVFLDAMVVNLVILYLLKSVVVSRSYSLKEVVMSKYNFFIGRSDMNF